MLGSFFNFDKFLTPILIKIIYWVGIAGIILATLFRMSTAAGAMQYDAAAALGGIMLAILGAAIALLFWRVICELWIVMFSINDRLGLLVDRGRV